MFTYDVPAGLASGVPRQAGLIWRYWRAACEHGATSLQSRAPAGGVAQCHAFRLRHPCTATESSSMPASRSRHTRWTEKSAYRGCQLHSKSQKRGGREGGGSMLLQQLLVPAEAAAHETALGANLESCSSKDWEDGAADTYRAIPCEKRNLLAHLIASVWCWCCRPQDAA